ncbi:hypothetical protein [Streptomyces griseocarneus]|uniref:hypothetical protein n=1 Tax=Streptomyces griseocarneus TaxID=51201 RepID=UPI00167CA288|nr:hypothetical protein [Streptomyces griseocarneus]MBZ6473469.1 hypothetical protein [Streptomyces griseocarneus]GHG56716.1 hypothetical protein GCM10018779_21210 [Streptomyces griseocarneus]
MSEQTALADAYERLYSASARMLWAQEYPAWRQEDSQWPAARREAWQALEQVLLEADASLGAPGQGEVSDPSRHLISRRAPGAVDRPLPFHEAVQDWRQRLAADPGFLVERMTPSPDFYMEPGACVVVPRARHFLMTGIFHELFFRVAPGRPGISLGPEAAELSAVAHEAADALRAPLGLTVPTPIPGAAPWITPVPHRFTDLPGLETRLEALRRAAWPAAETVPTVEEKKASADFSLRISVCKAAADVRELLAGRPAPAWREQYEQIDPARHGVVGLDADASGPRPTSFAEEAAAWRRAFAKGPSPWTPEEYQRQFYPDRGEKDVALSATRALVFAELLDEFAARHYPGRQSGLIHYSAYEFGQFVREEFGREMRDHVGF